MEGIRGTSINCITGGNYQAPSTNNQIIPKTPITKILGTGAMEMSFRYLDIGYWNLFGVWDLVIGI
jgi:hypothetical protein